VTRLDFKQHLENSKRARMPRLNLPGKAGLAYAVLAKARIKKLSANEREELRRAKADAVYGRPGASRKPKRSAKVLARVANTAEAYESK
jgi:hypothetical protein